MIDSTDGRGWRRLAWGGAAALLAVPAVAMCFTGAVRWTSADFAVMAVLLGGLALAFDRISRRGDGSYRAAGGLALIAALLATWVELAVGVVGEGGNAASLLFLGGAAVAGAGAVGAGLAAAGMRRAMLLAASIQGAAGMWLVAQLAMVEPVRWAVTVGILSVLLTGCWLAAAWLFGRVANRDLRLR